MVEYPVEPAVEDLFLADCRDVFVRHADRGELFGVQGSEESSDSVPGGGVVWVGSFRVHQGAAEDEALQAAEQHDGRVYVVSGLEHVFVHLLGHQQLMGAVECVVEGDVHQAGMGVEESIVLAGKLFHAFDTGLPWCLDACEYVVDERGQ
ncbi:hypothetical protein CRH09_24150 [Nocardia terpenica]|uniref:Uncharacterized protein n=1 Tax=Nocardia terpenica TaxID=455432 RepID=A0A291RNE8_9NOCA|nr:hypothetical protein CRH09_24150 [Nocardia terpenica]